MVRRPKHIRAGVISLILALIPPAILLLIFLAHSLFILTTAYPSLQLLPQNHVLDRILLVFVLSTPLWSIAAITAGFIAVLKRENMGIAGIVLGTLTLLTFAWVALTTH